MSHSWDSPARIARDMLLDTLESRLGDRAVRKEIVDLALEEFDNQFADPDDEMIKAGLLAFDANFPRCNGTNYQRSRLIEEIWRAMAARAFDR